MNECERICNFFGELLDGQLDPQTEKSVRDHLSQCTGCREDLKWLGITVQSLTGLEKLAPPPDFVAQVRLRISSSPPNNAIFQFFRNVFSASPYMPLPVGVSALALIAVLGLVFYNHVPSLNATTGLTSARQPASHTQGALSSGVNGVTVAQRQSDNRFPDHSQARSFLPSPSTAVGLQRPYAMSAPRSHTQSSDVKNRLFPTRADVIGADNLTVESPSVQNAVNSLKKMLPGMEGRLIDEKSREDMHEIVIGILIPSSSYGRLTKELINHGAVEAGAGADIVPPKRADTEGNHVVLHVRFVSRR